MNRILTVLDGIPFGKRYFEVGILLRNSLLVSSMMFNCEALYNVTDAELNLLETIDLLLLRQLLHAPMGTPKEMLFLELGVIPFREIVRERRLNFLHYIVHEDPNSLLHRFFQTQLKNKTKKDWATTVLNDLEKLDMKELTMENIMRMKKSTFKNMVKQKIEEKAFEDLENKKSSHSKVEKLEHNILRIQKYLQPSKIQISKEEAQLIFKLRCRVTEAKVNLKCSMGV